MLLGVSIGLLDGKRSSLNDNGNPKKLQRRDDKRMVALGLMVTYLGHRRELASAE